MRNQLLAALLLLVSAGFCSAQAPKGNVFFGYSYARASSENLNGWNGSLEGKIFPFVGIVADFSGQYGGDNTSMYNALFGPRVSFSVAGVRPFAHALFGVGHTSTRRLGFSDSSTDFSNAFGGGLDIQPIPVVGWRFQGDYLATRFFGSTQHDFRFSTGIVLRF